MRRALLIFAAGCFSVPDPSPGSQCSAAQPECPPRQTCISDRCTAMPDPADPVCAAPVLHDEDADGIDDACDPCPHIRGDALDGDGDGVGDACDPAPLEPKQRIVLFDPFSTMTDKWTYHSGTALLDDTLRMNALPDASASVRVPNREHRIALGGTVVVQRGDPSDNPKIAVEFGHASDQLFHFVELFDMAKIVESRAGGYDVLDERAMARPVPVGPWSVQIDESVSRDRILFDAAVDGQQFMGLIGIPSAHSNRLRPGDHVSLYVRNLDLRIDYLLMIETTP